MKATMTTTKQHVLGIDAGGTKTMALVARRDGEVLGMGLAGPGNFQVIGKEQAGEEIGKAITQALTAAKVSAEDISDAAYGVSGADREEDFDTVADYVMPQNPADDALIANDTTIALRAGTTDGVGVALIAGTGSNCIGFNADGKQAKVGGLGELSGDCGSGQDLVEQAIASCFRMADGRGPNTLLYDLFCDAFGLDDIEDLIARWYPDEFDPPVLGSYAPLLFKAAGLGDKEALRILTRNGKELGRNAVICARRLFKKDDAFEVVLGGSILQKPNPPVMPEAIAQALAKSFPKAQMVRLKEEPVLGALYYALDMAHGKAGKTRMARARKTFRALLKANEA